MADSEVSEDNYKRVNTFSRHPSLPQISSYIVILIEILVFYIIAAPALSSGTLKAILIVLYSVSLVATFVTTFQSSYIDPSDSILILSKKGKLSEVR